MKYIKSNINENFSGFNLEACRNHEEAADFLWFIGAIASITFPLLLCFVYLGLTASIVYALSVIVGMIVGVVWYLRFPRRSSSCINTGVLQTDTWQMNPSQNSWQTNRRRIAVN